MIEYVAIAGVALWLVHEGRKNKAEQDAKRAEEEKRKNTPCRFEDGFSQDQFVWMVKRAGKNIRRIIAIDVCGPIVYGTLRTVSGASEDDFTLDFNDYGHITGKYWKDTDSESTLPDALGENIQKELQNWKAGISWEKYEQSLRDSMTGKEAKNCSTQESSDAPNFTDKEVVDPWKGVFKEKRPNPNYETYESGTSAHARSAEQKRATKKQSNKHHSVKVGMVIAVTITLFVIFIGIAVLYQEYINQKLIVVGASSHELEGENYASVEAYFTEAGFTTISLREIDDLEITEESKSELVTDIYIGDDSYFTKSSSYSSDKEVVIVYHTLHMVNTGLSAKDMKGENYLEIFAMLEEAGFISIETEAEYDIMTGWFTEDEEIEQVSIDGDTDFNANTEFRPDAAVIITYHTYKKNRKDE